MACKITASSKENYYTRADRDYKNFKATLGQFIHDHFELMKNPSSSDSGFLLLGVNKIALHKFTKLHPITQSNICKQFAILFPVTKDQLQVLLIAYSKMIACTKTGYSLAWEVTEHLTVPSDRSEEVIKTNRKLLNHMNAVQLRTHSVITAHGIESPKGGFNNLINIMLSGSITKGQFGPLCDGLPNLNSGSHGPYYVVGDRRRTYAYIVPTIGHKDAVMFAIDNAVEKKIISEGQAVDLRSRTVTFQDVISFSDNALSDNKEFAKSATLINQLL